MPIGSQIGLNNLNQLSSRSFIYTYPITVKKKPDLYKPRVEAKGAKFSSSQAQEPNDSGQRGLHA